ncbi:alpha/beta hydrolase [Chitinophagaceae bacterium LWZ2-11]
MKNKRLLCFLLLLAFLNKSKAEVDTVGIYSKSMHKIIKAVVITPSSYKKDHEKHFPVVYLLHGYSGNFSNWITKVPRLQSWADEFNLMIVCPDGAFSSWYFDSPIDSSYRYETHVGLEVPEYIDAHYKTIPDRMHRAITGLSMGGHGGLFLGFRHPDIYGACGSTSGGVDLHASIGRFDVAKRIGDTALYANNWNDYSVTHVIEQYPKEGLSIIIDCGTSDIFYDVNNQLHQKMLQLKIPHDFIIRPGGHDWNYWTNSIKYQLLFFREYFEKSK